MEISRFQFVPIVPANYILSKARFCWREIEWAYQHGMFGLAMLVDLAKQKEQNQVIESELSSLDKDHQWKAPELLSALVQNESQIAEQSIVEKWLYVILAYIYDHQDKFEDPLTKVEEIYADFNHPKEIASFVGYMPSSDTTYRPEEHSLEENTERIFKNWKEYLDREAAKYS